jgi:hypothetical protein
MTQHTPGPWPTDIDLYLDAAFAAAKGSKQHQWPPRTVSSPRHLRCCPP